MRQKSEDLMALTDKDVKLLCSSLDKRIKRILQVRGKLSGKELKDANDCLENCSDLLYKMRMWRRSQNNLV